MLTAATALTLGGASTGVALAQDTPALDVKVADSDVLCGLIGGCSEESTSSADDDSAVFSSDELDSMTDQSVPDAAGGSSARGAPSTPSDTERAEDRVASAGVPAQASSIDEPPPPGQVRTIDLPG